MTDRELMQQALDALEVSTDWDMNATGKQARSIQSINALRARLAQPEPEPVAWGILNTRPTEKQPLMMVMLDEPEPSHLVVPLYTAPPQREWKGLTEGDIAILWKATPQLVGVYSYTDIAREVETKLKEKNT